MKFQKNLKINTNIFANELLGFFIRGLFPIIIASLFFLRKFSIFIIILIAYSMIIASIVLSINKTDTLKARKLLKLRLIEIIILLTLILIFYCLGKSLICFTLFGIILIFDVVFEAFIYDMKKLFKEKKQND